MNERRKEFLLPKEPRPSWRDFRFSSKTAGFAGVGSLAASRFLFFWARNAIYHSLRALGVQPGEAVLVPAYICAAAVEPIEAYGAKVVFYEVHPNCLPDFADLESKIDSATRAILTVHYFGFPCGIQQIRKICNQHRLFLIEDCAHVLKGEHDGQMLGTFGDASVFSWRKFLPVYDGATLVLNRGQHELAIEWTRESLLFTVRTAKNLLERTLPDALVPALRIPRIPQPSSADGAASSGHPPRNPWRLLDVDPNSASFSQEMVNFPISRLSRVLLKHFAIEKIIARRRENYLFLQQRLSHLKGIKLLFDDLPIGVCPWVLPLFLENMPNSHVLMRKMGIPAVSWGGVRYPKISSAEFPDADFLYENLIFLPIHQDLQPKHLDLLVETIRTVRENRAP
jgi:perosamine synthetase